MAVTIRDVAKRLHLSITTVSRALDGYADVAAKTRARVIHTARVMGYVPSRAARQLRRQRTDAIGYILPAQPPYFTDPFSSTFIAGLGDAAAAHNLDLLISTAAPDSDAEQHIYTRWTQSRPVDGIILNRLRLKDWRVKYLAQNDFPFVAHGHARMRLDFPYIEMDSRAGFVQLVQHLIAQGHRRIAYIGAPAKFTLQTERFAGYQDGLAAGNLPFDARLVGESDLTRTGGYQAAQRLLAQTNPLPTAIICVNDLTAIGAMRAARERGLVIGRDLAIAGYDGTEDAEHTEPPLTTLKQPIYNTARQLVEMLLQRIAGEPISEPHIVIQPELILRESTAFQISSRVKNSVARR
ncbi:MAG: LacI family DNA-binding transcriptional regulator [Chloroflexi bacterium]|nr:LacI family DNA-binding transcriptional regulator [Chloroflexota bacterium]